MSMKILSAFLGLLLTSSIALAQPYAPGTIAAQACTATPTITAGGTAQTVIAAKQAPNGFAIYNVDTTEALWVSLVGPAAIGGGGASNSFPLAAGAATTFAGTGVIAHAYGFPSGGPVSLNATTTGHKFACYYW
jgi:hypothetical protein